ncbi:MAG: CocE/NonD family hydrolase, partial [Chitinophagales bacterium]
MKKLLFVLALQSLLLTFVKAQTNTGVRYKKTSSMIPMRDGIKLYTVIIAPEDVSQAYPILIQRTPYGASVPYADDSVFNMPKWYSFYNMAVEGYIFVIQDIRGKYKSEGRMEIHQPLLHSQNPSAVDESTDTWDAVDWLVKNVPHNNGKAGIVGVSYPGWLALVGAVDPHPALKASSEQACMGDLFLGDDFHHNGAFRLSYGMEYSYEVEFDHTKDSDFPFPQFDLFDWYIHLGPLKNVNEKYFHNKIPTWNNFVDHPNYDSFWQKNSPLNYVQYAQIPVLHVGGYYDQEDINGPQLMFKHMEKKDSFARNHIVLGPWNHGGWAAGKGDSLGKIAFHSNTGEWFRELQKKWFDYYLKGIGDGHFDKAYCFQTGSNKWKTYSKWPPAESTIKKLYAAGEGKASFIPPTAKTGFTRFISDPANPVPYRTLPIEATYGRGSRWRIWHVEDQRFATTRPDVISFSTDTLTEDITVTGDIMAHVFASTTGTDADWIVKLIDVYPDFFSENILLSQYELPVAMEAFRGRYRKSFSNPTALIPNKPEEFVVGLHEINHRFKRGHRIRIQIQSSWFPVIDMNPQQWVPNIFEAKESDFKKAEHTIYFNADYPTHVELPIG